MTQKSDCHDYYLSEIDREEDINKKAFRVGKKKKSIQEKIFDQALKGNTSQIFYPKKEDIAEFPENSTLLRISFELKKPYVSKDEGEFHTFGKNADMKIFENPLVRDRFLGHPMVRPSTWKGHLRFAAGRVKEISRKRLNEGERKKIIERLFGSEPEDENNLRGRLYFFPTFFGEDGGKDIITPLSRETRTPVAGRSPVSLEVMKAGSKGEFYLLYVPYPKGKNFKEGDVREDLCFLAEAMELMFYIYGFSAKKTSGFGTIKEKLKDGVLWTKLRTRIEEKSFSKIDELENIINRLWGENSG